MTEIEQTAAAIRSAKLIPTLAMTSKDHLDLPIDPISPAGLLGMKKAINAVEELIGQGSPIGIRYNVFVALDDRQRALLLSALSEAKLLLCVTRVPAGATMDCAIDGVSAVFSLENLEHLGETYSSVIGDTQILYVPTLGNVSHSSVDQWRPLFQGEFPIVRLARRIQDSVADMFKEKKLSKDEDPLALLPGVTVLHATVDDPTKSVFLSLYERFGLKNFCYMAGHTIWSGHVLKKGSQEVITERLKRILDLREEGYRAAVDSRSETIKAQLAALTAEQKTLAKL